MTYEILSALILFAFVSSITPGPNNLMLMASGANFGFLRTVPHMLGIGLGFTFMVLMVGAGLMKVFEAIPASHTVLKVLSIAYLLYLAWKIGNSSPVADQADTGTPMTFLQAAAFQWVNPKAWTMALTAISVYAPDRTGWTIVLVAATFGAVNLPCVSSWTVIGQQMAKLLKSPRRLIAFNWTMAALLVLSIIPTL